MVHCVTLLICIQIHMYIYICIYILYILLPWHPNFIGLGWFVNCYNILCTYQPIALAQINTILYYRGNCDRHYHLSYLSSYIMMFYHINFEYLLYQPYSTILNHNISWSTVTYLYKKKKTTYQLQASTTLW